MNKFKFKTHTDAPYLHSKGLNVSFLATSFQVLLILSYP